MTLYHIEKWKYRDVWPPEGTLHADGRWNKPGQWLIYCSPTISLAKLEILANDSFLPVKRVCMTIDVNMVGSLFKVSKGDLPYNWFEKPYLPKLQEYTVRFLDSQKLMMEVPSAQIFRENNILINVRHPAFHTNVHLTDISPEPFDGRLKE